LVINPREKRHAKVERITPVAVLPALRHGFTVLSSEERSHEDKIVKDKIDIFVSKLLKRLGTKTYRINER
jgi:hypothetical protein